jgi:hypothetical protein
VLMGKPIGRLSRLTRTCRLLSEFEEAPAKINTKTTSSKRPFADKCCATMFCVGRGLCGYVEVENYY